MFPLILFTENFFRFFLSRPFFKTKGFCFKHLEGFRLTFVINNSRHNIDYQRQVTPKKEDHLHPQKKIKKASSTTAIFEISFDV